MGSQEAAAAATAAVKWKGKVSTTLTTVTADQIWPLFADFFGLGKWFPGLATCRGVHGSNGEPGCVRYCAGFSVSASATGSHCGGEGGDDSSVKWSKERLVSVDSTRKRLSYEIVESNIGFESYESTVEIVPRGNGGCVIEWEFGVDALQGWVFEDLVNKYQVGLNAMAKNMEDYVLTI